MDVDIKMTPQRRFMLTIILMTGTLMQVLDSTIANVALPHMQASLGAAPDTISWVLTSYIIAAAIATPVTGWLETRIGRRSLLLYATGGFTLASVMCGLSTSLIMMVLARVMQGICGAFLVPLSQSTMLDIYPFEQRTKAMTIWGIGVMIAPIFGPVIGGVLTDAYNWRWVFFVNVPVGIFAFVGALMLMPNIKFPRLSFDLVGFSMLAIGLASLQLMLDRGSQEDWFNSVEIIVELLLSVGMFWMFIIHTIMSKNAIIPRELFLDRNFVIANVFILIVTGVLMSSAALIPPMLQGVYGYDTTEAGLLIMPRGLAMLCSMMSVGRIVRVIDTRFVVIVGMGLISFAQWEMTGFSPEMDSWPIIMTGLIQGLGFGFVIMPLNLIAFATVRPELRTSAASVWGLSRNVGGSIAIAVFSAIFTRNLQVSHSDLAGGMSILHYPFVNAGLAEKVGVQSSTVLSFMNGMVNQQAAMISYLDNFWLMSVVSVCIMPLLLMLRPSKQQPTPEMMAME